MDDNDIMGGLDAAIRNFRDLVRGRKPREPNLDAVAGEVFMRIRGICLIRMRPVTTIGQEGERETSDDVVPESQLVPVETISMCLKKIRKSVDNWHGVGGRRGYLEFVRPYFAADLADDNEVERE